MKHLVLLSAIFLFLFTSCVDRNAFSIYCIGDSTMANKTEDVVPETGWCQVLDQYINGPITIKNHARNGRSTKSFINEGLWETVLDSLQKGDFVFIQFGHNDQKDYDTLRYTRPFSTFSDNLRKFVNESREKGANPVLPSLIHISEPTRQADGVAA
jgi:pectinesterase